MIYFKIRLLYDPLGFDLWKTKGQSPPEIQNIIKMQLSDPYPVINNS